MTRTGQNAHLWSGDDITLSVTVTDSAGAAVSLSSGTLTYRLVTLAGVTVLTKTSASGITVTNAAGGVFQVALDAADTADLSGVYRHEAQLVQGGVTSTLFVGTLTIEQDAIV